MFFLKSFHEYYFFKGIIWVSLGFFHGFSESFGQLLEVLEVLGFKERKKKGLETLGGWGLVSDSRGLLGIRLGL